MGLLRAGEGGLILMLILGQIGVAVIVRLRCAALLCFRRNLTWNDIRREVGMANEVMKVG